MNLQKRRLLRFELPIPIWLQGWRWALDCCSIQSFIEKLDWCKRLVTTYNIKYTKHRRLADAKQLIEKQLQLQGHYIHAGVSRVEVNTQMFHPCLSLVPILFSCIKLLIMLGGHWGPYFGLLMICFRDWSPFIIAKAVLLLVFQSLFWWLLGLGSELGICRLSCEKDIIESCLALLLTVP